jgi:hypothetical protein
MIYVLLLLGGTITSKRAASAKLWRPSEAARLIPGATEVRNGLGVSLAKNQRLTEG